MVSIETKENIIFTVAEGKLHDVDYDKIIPVLEEKVRTFGKIRWYFEMRHFEGWTPGAMWKDLQFDFKNRHKLEKVAMVGNKEWEKYLSLLMKPFTDAEIKFFGEKDQDTAKQWISQLK